MLSSQSLNIVLIEPFFTGSHKAWAEGYQQSSQHNIHIISLKGIYWKWRMHGGAITLAKMFNEYIKNNGMPDILLVTDMLNLPVPAPNFHKGFNPLKAGDFAMSPIHVKDVASIFVKSIK